MNSFVKATIKTAGRQKVACLAIKERCANAPFRAEYKDAVVALRDKALRTPYPETFILVSIKEDSSAVLVGVEDGGFVDDEGLNYGLRKFRTVSPILDKENELVWSPVNLYSKGKRVSPPLTTLLGLIADRRSSVTRTSRADEKLQRARLKRGKAPIPGYFLVEARGQPSLLPTPHQAY